MRIAVLSGKGGTGKTFVSVNLASVADKCVYIDCDIEEPNGYIFFNTNNNTEIKSFKLHPVFLSEKCTGCRKCVEFCHFNALAFIGNKPKVFDEVCHSCGGCMLVCPYGAINEEKREIGKIIVGQYNNIKVVTGRMNLGEASGIPIIQQMLENKYNENLQVVDCPPGSSCLTMESISSADYCVIVAEPTKFGFDNFKMVVELANICNKKIGVLINKANDYSDEITKYCYDNNIHILEKIKYNPFHANYISDGKIVSEYDDLSKKTFKNLLHLIQKECL